METKEQDEIEEIANQLVPVFIRLQEKLRREHRIPTQTATELAKSFIELATNIKLHKTTIEIEYDPFRSPYFFLNKKGLNE